MKTFILSEADIQSIINGRDVIKQDGNSKILIRQSYVKDMAAPIIKDRFVVSDSKFDNRIRTSNNSIINPLFRKWETMKTEELIKAKKYIEHVIGTIKHDGHLGTIQTDLILPDLEKALAAIGGDDEQ